MSKKRKNNNTDKIIDKMPPELVDRITQGLYAGKPLMGENGLLTGMIKQILESGLQGEMDHHLEEKALDEGGNRRNGLCSKRVTSGSGSFDLDVPRDRNSSFEPELVKKRQTSLNEELNDKIMSLYALGNSSSDIAYHMSEIYGLSISDAKISAVTDRLLPELQDWRSRPLDKQYAIIFLDAMFFKTRQDGKVQTKAVYNIMGVNMDGKKEILGFYAAESEGSHFWLSVLNELKNRGVEDIFIACIDGLKGFPDAINSVFPKTEIQLCVVHQIRNSLRLVGSKDSKAFMRDLKLVYQADTKDMAEHNLLLLDEKWGKKYPLPIKSWQENWQHLSEYFKYSKELRKLVYTTNPIEGFHRQIRKYTKSKAAFTSDNALYKLVFAAIKNISAKWTAPIQNWAAIISQIDIYFPDRVKFRK